MAAKGGKLVKWDEQMAAMAEAAAAAEQGGSGNFMSLKGGVMSYRGNQLPGNKVEVIVLASIQENQFFMGDYDPDSPQSPACYAFGRKEPGKELIMVPHEQAPQKQASSCAECEHFEWGSAEKGRGKACKEVRRLCLILADSLEVKNGIADAEEVFLKVPVTSVKAWSGYVQQIAGLKRPPFAVVTEISVVSDPKTQFRLQFKLVEQVKDAPTFEALLTRHKDAEAKIITPYPVFDEEEKSRRGSKKKSRTQVAAAPVAKRGVKKKY